MPWLDRWDERNQEAAEADAELHRVVTAPDGSRFELAATEKDWALGTGSIILDVAAFAWGLIRQARGRGWVVTAKRAGGGSDPIERREVRSHEEAVEVMSDLAAALESGRRHKPAG